MANYTTSEELHNLIVLHQSGHPQGRLVELFYTMARGLAGRYFDRDEDAVQRAVMVAWQRLDRYDPARGGAFGFFTTCMANEMKQARYKEHRHRQVMVELWNNRCTAWNDL